jgi:two-component system OmpR family sensor kinase
MERRPHAERRWYRSLYWRIAIGYVALLAVLLLLQTGLAIWLTDRVWGRASRTPAQLAELAASDLSAQLTANSSFDIQQHVRDRYRSGYQPFVVVVDGDPRTYSNRDPIPPNLFREARRRLRGELSGGREFEPPFFRRGGSGGRGMGPDNGAPAEFAEILVSGKRVGIVAVPGTPPPLSVSLRETAPTLAIAGVALLGAGSLVVAFLIFRPTRRRLQTLEHAARSLGEGRSDVHADESGGDEVSALSVTFNAMARDLQARATALSESDRARRQLLADVSHELMTPLAAIRGYVETLTMRELRIDEPTRARYLEIVEEETHKLEAIIGDLLDLARLEGGGDTLDFEAVLVDDLLRRVADRHQPVLLERSITLTTAAAANTPLIWGDPDRLEQALQNVAANAIRHTPDGGTVILRAEPLDERVKITITDNGPGIPPDHLPHIFDRFYKADASRAGTHVPSGSGLGLSIVQAIVHRHGGEVWADNIAGGGAVFTLLLPSVAVAKSAVGS